MLHIPFIYYIGKENVLIAVDEISRYNLSGMIDRIRLGKILTGDPRYFKAQQKDK